ncbi:MAG: hypothetical protein KBD06_00945 [Candidatus Pacebacteria bacterium]|nr:hypothetical protein [Candidatus Paceibacterota bacterium]
MYSITSKVVATGVIAVSLLAAAPVFADSGQSGRDNGLHLGVFAKLLHDDRKEDRSDRREDRREDRKDSRTEKKHATTTLATSSKQFVIQGSVTAISGTTLSVQGARDAVYTVNGSSASIFGHQNVAIPFSTIKAGDKVQITGTITGGTVVATKIKDKSDETGKVSRSFNAGIVTGVNGSIMTLGNFGSTGTSTFVTNSATKYKVNGTAASSSALTLGSHVLVFGTTTAGSTTVNASLIVILTDGLNWLRHFWK